VNTDLVTEINNRIAANNALGVAIGDIQLQTSNTMTFLQQEIVNRTESDSALVQELNVLAAAMNDGIAALAYERVVRADADGLMAADITTAQTSLNGDTASGQVGLITQVSTLNGTVEDIGALFTAKLSVNGLIGGFGVYNDGTTVEAGFDVDRFWVGRTNGDKRKPFIIENGETFIDQAVINKLTFTKLQDETGNFVVENGKIKADYIKVGSIDLVGSSNFRVRSSVVGARTEMDADSIRVYDESGVLRVQLGKLS
jgi:hypothetical protein